MKTILIVEDMEMNVDLITQLLEDDYNLLVARDGAMGVEMAEKNKPDLVLMDISLPVMDGYQAASAIHALLPSLPIIGLSAHAMQGDIEKALTAGCTGYLTKPIDEEALFTLLTRYLE
jgi:CheY-like chemotaxis protein